MPAILKYNSSLDKNNKIFYFYLVMPQKFIYPKNFRKF